MNAEDVLFSPVVKWRELCSQIVTWIEANRNAERKAFQLCRPRPSGAMLLKEFLESYWEYGQRFFWRLDNNNSASFLHQITRFEFDGLVIPVNDDLPYPAYSEVGWDYYRSVEDVNLVPNTYTSYFIFRTEHEANQGLTFVYNQSP